MSAADMPAALGRYKLEKELGQGAMGRVYLGHDPAIGRKVALKVIHLPPGMGPSDRREAEARFSREIQAAGRLSHPGIVTVYDVGHDDQVGTFVAMEYVEGVSLDTLLASGNALPPRAAASILCQAADALAYAHRQGIVHRDIKPANLIVIGEQTVKVADFGLAKPEGSHLTSDGTMLGTPYYMSPEQIEGKAVDGRSDLFSLGVVAYELLTGKRPFRGDSVSTVIYRILHEPPVAPDLAHVAGAESVKDFLAQALAKDPTRRFADGDAFARALREAMSGVGGGTAASPTAGSAGGGRVRGSEPGDEGEGFDAHRPRRQGPVTPMPGGASATARLRPGARRPSRRRSMSLMPVWVLFTVLMAVAWVYRDALVEAVLPQLGGDASESTATLPAGGGRTEPAMEKLKPGDSPPHAAVETAADQPARSRSDDGTGAPAAAVVAVPAESTAGRPPDAAGRQQPAARPDPPPAEIQLLSQPAGAVFRVGGVALAGDRLAAPEGDESLLVSAQRGCLIGEVSVMAVDAGRAITIPLQAETMPVRVEARPGKSTVVVNGREVGRTPLTVELDRCEDHVVTVKRAEYRDWSRELMRVEGRLEAPETLRAELVPLPRGILKAPDPPYPVTMTLAGGRELKAGEEVSVVADTYRITFANEKLMYRHQLRVRIVADRTVTPDIEFPPLADFQLLASPSNVQFSIESESGRRQLGSPPFIGGIQVVPGSYTLVCVFGHNQEEQRRNVVLEAGRNGSLKFVAEKP